MNLQDLLNNAFRKTQRDMGHINILIAGRTGVGKSTLINSVFKSNLAETGQGRPVTSTTREVTEEGVPLTLFDTRDLETKDYTKTFAELETLVINRCGDRDSDQHIHLAWLCIHEDGRRVEDAEIALHEMLAKHIPVVTVITKARSDNGFRSDVITLLPQSRSAVRVRAIFETLDEGHELLPMSLVNLIEVSSDLIPEGKRNAFAAAQKADMNFKKKRVRTIVAGAVTAAAATGASPIPFSDLAILAPVQVTMLAGITTIYGFELSKASLITLAGSLVGVGGAALAGRAIVSNLLKLIPAIGTMAGGAISATTAATLTTALGAAYIRTLETFFTENPDARPNPEELADRLMDELRKGRDSK